MGTAMTNALTNCIAHELAVKRCKVMHRDISAGNILILPKLVTVAKGIRVSITGVLSDWELAKHIPLNGIVAMQAQPERTVRTFLHPIPCSDTKATVSIGYMAVHAGYLPPPARQGD